MSQNKDVLHLTLQEWPPKGVRHAFHTQRSMTVPQHMLNAYKIHILVCAANGTLIFSEISREVSLLTS